MARTWLLLFVFVLFYVISCDKEDPIGPTNLAPVLSNLVVPDTVFTQTDQRSIFSVTCSDENGLDDIDSVAYKIFSNSGQPVTAGIMFDDGNYETHGDNIARDGKYSIRLKLDLIDGSYRFVVQAVDQAMLKSNELQKIFYAKMGVINHAPVILKYRLPDSVYVDQIVPFVVAVRASDPDSLDYISKVIYQILGPAITDLAEEGVLNDTGINGDSLAGDGIYSITTTTKFAEWKFGAYHLIIQAFDSRNKPSNTIYEILPWAKLKLGVPPRIFNIVAPDTIEIPEKNVDGSVGIKAFLLSITATDDDNNKDVMEVKFNSYKPGGEPAKNNPFDLYDDGDLERNGDAVAGDYIFSRIFIITSDNLLGVYKFEFQAKDYSNLKSNIITHNLTVIQ